MSKKLRESLKKTIASFVMIATIVSLSGVIALAPAHAAAVVIKDGDTIQNPSATGDAKYDVYIVKLVGTQKFKRLVLNPQVFNSYGQLSWSNIKSVDQATMDSYTTSAMVRVETDPKVYALAPNGDLGSKSWLSVTAATFEAAGGNWNSVYVINATDGANYAAADPLTTQAQVVTFLTAGALPGVSPTPTPGASPTPAPSTTPVAGVVAVALAADNPASRSVVTAEAGADLAHFAFTGSGSVTNVSLKRTGISRDASLLNVYLYDGSTRLTDAASVSNGSIITFNDPNGLFTVNGAKTISVKSDMAALAGESIGVQLVSATIGAVAVTGAPLSGNLMSVATATLADVTFGAVTPSANTSLTPASDIVVWQSTASVITRDVTLSRFTIREVGGVAKADIKNIRLMVDNIVIGTVANPDANGYSTFTPASALTLKTGSHVFKVVADVVGGSSLSFTFSIRNKTDIGLVDSQYGVGFLTSTAIGSLTGFQQTVATGYITVQKATDSPSSTVILASTDSVLGRFTATTYGENVKVDTLLFDFGGTASTKLRNGRILVDGQQVGSTATIDPAGTGTSFNVNYTFKAGTTAIIELRSDIFDNDGTGAYAAGDTIQAILRTGVNNAQGLISGDATLDVPNSDISGNTLTVGSGSMVLAKDQSYGNQSMVVPTTASLLGSWTLTSGTNEAINMDTIQVDFTTADEFAPADLTNVYVMYGLKATSTKATITATSGTTSVGNSWSISESLPINTSMTFKVYGNIATGAVVTTTQADTVIPSLKVSGTTVSGTAVNTNSDAVLQGQMITAVNSGVLTVSLDTNTPVAAQVVAGTTDAAGALKIKLAGTNENQYVKSLKVYVDTSVNTAAISSMNLAWSATSNGTYATVGTDQTVVNDGTLPGYAAWNLSGDGRITVVKNGSIYLKVTPTYVSSGQTAVTGKTPKLFLGDIQAEGTSVLTPGPTGSLVNSTGIVIQANSSATYVTTGVATVTTAQPAATTAAGAAATDATYLTHNALTLNPGDIIFVDESADSLFTPASEDLEIVLADTGTVARVARGVFGETAYAHTTGKTIYRLSGVVATYTNAGIVGSQMTVLNTKLGLAIKSDSPSGASTGGTGKYLFGVTASAANNSADSATNTATITYFDVTNNKSVASVANLKAYPAEYDNNSSYATTCVGLSATKWRCTLVTTGSTNQVDENSSRSYTFRGDLGYSAAGSVDFSVAALGTSSTSTNSVYWTDGTTPQYWVNQPTTVIQGGSLTTTGASGSRDQASPVIASVTPTNVAVSGDIAATDKIIIVFNEMIDPTTINASLLPNDVAVTGIAAASTGGVITAIPNNAGGGDDTVTVTNILTLTLTSAGGATSFADGSLSLNSTGTQLTVTVGTGNARTIDRTAIAGAGIASTVTDVNGNLLATTAPTIAAGAF